MYTIRAFDRYHNQRPWMAVYDHFAVFQNTRIFQSPLRKCELLRHGEFCLRQHGFFCLLMWS